MERKVAEHIRKHIEGRQEEIRSFLEKLVSLETPSRDPGAQEPLFDLLSAELEDMGYFAQHYAGRDSGGYLLAYPENRPKNAPVQLLIGHVDTVWARDTLQSMPFEMKDGTIKGPGVFDMKAGITQMIFALKAIDALGLDLPVVPVLLINSDEEIGSRDSGPAIRRLAKVAERAFVLEPPLGLQGHLKTARKGVGRFHIYVRGIPAHAGLNPGEGVSAIMEMSYQIQQLFALNDFEKGITVNVGMIEGGSSPNVIAEESSAVIDVRVKTASDAEFIESALQAMQPKFKGTELRVEGRFGRPPMERTPGNRRLWKLARDLGSLLELELEEAEAGGGSDGNTTSLYTPTLDGLGTTGDGAHARHEFIYSEKLLERTALLTLLLLAEPIRNQVTT